MYLLWEVTIRHLRINQHSSCTMKWARVPIRLLKIEANFKLRNQFISHIHFTQKLNILIWMCDLCVRELTCPALMRASIAHPVFTMWDLLFKVFVYTCLNIHYY